MSMIGTRLISLICLRGGLEKKSSIDEYHIFRPDEVEQFNVWNALYEAIIQKNPDRVVIDSASQLHYLSPDIYQFRKQILKLIKFLNERGITSFLIFEPTEFNKTVTPPSVNRPIDRSFNLGAKITLENPGSGKLVFVFNSTTPVDPIESPEPAVPIVVFSKVTLSQ